MISERWVTSTVLRLGMALPGCHAAKHPALA